MLINIKTMKLIKVMPHKEQFEAYKRLLTDDEYTEICEEIDRRVEGKEVNTSSWIPGNKWDGTAFDALSRICNGDKEASGLAFGLFVFKVFMDRDDVWSLGRYKKGDVQIKGMTYFRLDKIDSKAIIS